MSRHVSFTALLVATLAVAPLASAPAQRPQPAAAPQTGCTYMTCALRVEESFWRQRLVRGAAGEEIGTLGPFGGGVEPLLAGPDSAGAHARCYVHAVRWATGLGIVGAAATTAAFVFRDNVDDATAAAVVVGTVFSVAALPFSLRARRSLSRAVWWYNAALPR